MTWWQVALVVGALALLAQLGRTKGKSPYGPRGPTRSSTPYPGDYQGKVTIEYAPNPDGAPDPGEVVWTWVPFQEDSTKGKDRPVLLIGRDREWLLGLMLTSKDHDNAKSREIWIDVGTGPWDKRRRPSEAKLDRIIRIDPLTVRREGATMPRATFDQVSHSLSDLHHW